MPSRISIALCVAVCVASVAHAAPSKKRAALPPAALTAPAVPTLTAGDRLLIKIVNEPDLSKEYVVDGAGNIQMDMLGNVKAAGMTLPEFQSALEKQLARYVRKPSFTVIATQRIGVAGGVHTPGAYDFPKEQPVRVMDALLRAGGLTREAKKGRVLVVRRAAAGAQPEGQLVDVGRFLKKGNPADNPVVGPNDLIYVDVEDVERQPKGIGGLLQKALPLLGAFL